MENLSQKSGLDMQTMINAKILDQLEKIGHRLDKSENKSCKKPLDKSKNQKFC